MQSKIKTACGNSTGSFLSAFFGKVRQTKTPDFIMVLKDDSVRYRVIPVSFYDFDKGSPGAHHDAHMVGPAGAVTQWPFIPGIIYVIPGKGQVTVGFLPVSQFPEKFNLPFTAAFRWDDIG